MTSRDKWMQQLDQDWADAREFIKRTDPSILTGLTSSLADDDTNHIREWMKRDPQIADLVTRLALLAMHEATARFFDAVAEVQS